MIALRDLSVAFGAGLALRSATLDIAPGDRLGIVGESGSGKTMLGLALLGMTPDAATVSGTLHIDGADMAHASEARWRALRARRVAMIFQEPMAALNPLARVGQILTEPLRVHLGLHGAQARDRARALLDEVGIPDPAARLQQYPHELSGGQRQRVLIALALTCDPALLIADEPTTALDANVALRITDLLVRLGRDRRMGLVFISHDLAAVARATTRIAVMYGGDIVETGPTADVLAAPAHPYTQGLLGARPGMVGAIRGADGTRRRLTTIPGTVPPLNALPRGCRFAGRCPVEMPHCADTRPGAVPVGTDRKAACLRLSEAAA